LEEVEDGINLNVKLFVCVTTIWTVNCNDGLATVDRPDQVKTLDDAAAAADDDDDDDDDEDERI